MHRGRIFVVSHKKFDKPNNEFYIPIQVGKAKDIYDNIIRDNVGDNIAEKNSNYCELTAVYWLWKNVHDLDFIGICHYRRYFTKNRWSKNSSYFLKERDVKRYMKKYDAIVPMKLNVLENVERFYYKYGEGRKKDIKRLKDIIYDKYPEYRSSLNRVLQAKAASYYNMVIMKKIDFDEYCEWLFDILFAIEDIIDLTDYSVSEARIYGYMSEILLNVWLVENNKKIKYVSVVNTEQKFIRRIINEAKNLIRSLEYIHER